LLLHRRTLADLCARRSVCGAVADLDTAAPSRLLTHPFVRADIHAVPDGDAHRNAEARGQRHLYFDCHAYIYPYALDHTQPYPHAHGNVHRDGDAHRHADRHPYPNANPYQHVHQHSHAQPDINADADRYTNADVDQYVDTHTYLHAEPRSAASAMMPVTCKANGVQRYSMLCKREP
jgi:hypothetical protein